MAAHECANAALVAAQELSLGFDFASCDAQDETVVVCGDRLSRALPCSHRRPPAARLPFFEW
jgi:hypothetical protein